MQLFLIRLSRTGRLSRFHRYNIRVIENSGRISPQSICLVVTDRLKFSEPWAVLTGDTLFIGDVGRPDLSNDFTSAQLTIFYDSFCTIN